MEGKMISYAIVNGVYL